MSEDQTAELKRIADALEWIRKDAVDAAKDILGDAGHFMSCLANVEKTLTARIAHLEVKETLRDMKRIPLRTAL